MNLRKFRDHLNDLFSTADAPFIPAAPGLAEPAHAETASSDGHSAASVPWAFDTRQFRRTLAWYIAHRPFGTVAGSLQFKHARLAVFEGYAGTSASGFTAELHAEEALARLDLLEDLYRDWNRGGRSGGHAAGRVNSEFERIRRELGDLPGLVADNTRLRVMLEHLDPPPRRTQRLLLPARHRSVPRAPPHRPGERPRASGPRDKPVPALPRRAPHHPPPTRPPDGPRPNPRHAPPSPRRARRGLPVLQQAFYRSPSRTTSPPAVRKATPTNPSSAPTRENPPSRTPLGRPSAPEHAHALCELEGLLNSYANQIQALTLDNHRLATQNSSLLRLLDNPPCCRRPSSKPLSHTAQPAETGPQPSSARARSARPAVRVQLRSSSATAARGQAGRAAGNSRCERVSASLCNPGADAYDAMPGRTLARTLALLRMGLQ